MHALTETQTFTLTPSLKLALNNLTSQSESHCQNVCPQRPRMKRSLFVRVI